MNKQEFVEKLRSKLSNLPKAEVEERLNFYIEMIDDRIEDGLSEDIAVADVGSVDKIAVQIAEDIPLLKTLGGKIKPKKSLSKLNLTLLIAGFPVWLPLLISAVAVIFSFYVSLWAVVISFWAAFVSLIVGSVYFIIVAIIFMFKNYIFDLYGTLIDIRTDEEDDTLWDKMVMIYGYKQCHYSIFEIRRLYKELCSREKAKV